MVVLSITATLATTGVLAQSRETANCIEVRVWEHVGEPERNYNSARPEGGSCCTLGTIPLAMDGETSRGTYRYIDITLMVPISTPEPEPDVKWSASSFEVTFGRERLRAHHGCVRFNGTLYVYVQGDPTRGDFNCHNSFTLFPEDGLTGLQCSTLHTRLEDISLVRAKVFPADGSNHEYRCEQDDILRRNTWVCALLT
ncbi:MAG: hypothetical protein OXE53_00530 [Deltaproteobacteria bacterium]|nr:hypothetical protein [Deltaproteobacteria bacterium]